ncbi:MAG TPA: response regulator transcription factor [Anaerolineae bacterium]|nr:response regulator transcription factor [Anaerolineae bacterium]
MIRVLICDDQTVVREGLQAILSTDAEIEVCGLAGDGREALRLATELRPDVVLMDLKMPVMNGVQATHALHSQHPEIHVLVLTTYADDVWIMDAVRAGASGYLLKDTRRDQLVDAIKGTAQGKSFIDPSVAGKIMRQLASAPRAPAGDASHAEAFTERELDVLELLVQGHSNPEIARRLYLAAGTVRNYVSSILQKLGVPDRTQAAVVAIQRGLVRNADHDRDR